jgi:tetratricopeptide (TPR) repeat protein
VAAAPPGHRDHSGFLRNLAGALHLRFQHRDDLTDLDEAIEAFQEAGSGYNAGVLLLTKFDRTGAIADLDLAIEAYQQALQQQDVAINHVLANLAVALRTRFNRVGHEQTLGPRRGLR